MIFGKDKKELKQAVLDCNHAVKYFESQDFGMARFCVLSVRNSLLQMLKNNGMTEEDCKCELTKFLEKTIEERVNDHQ